jgi:hypothetical protein
MSSKVCSLYNDTEHGPDPIMLKLVSWSKVKCQIQAEVAKIAFKKTLHLRIKSVLFLHNTSLALWGSKFAYEESF